MIVTFFRAVVAQWLRCWVTNQTAGGLSPGSTELPLLGPWTRPLTKPTKPYPHQPHRAGEKGVNNQPTSVALFIYFFVVVVNFCGVCVLLFCIIFCFAVLLYLYHYTVLDILLFTFHNCYI